MQYFNQIPYAVSLEEKDPTSKVKWHPGKFLTSLGKFPIH